jgi:hypothetical protein
MKPGSLPEIARAMVADHKGLLAMDESSGTCSGRLAEVGIPQTVESRRAYRELILTTLGRCSAKTAPARSAGRARARLAGSAESSVRQQTDARAVDAHLLLQTPITGVSIMLRSIKDLEGFAVVATDGQIGHVEDFYFDDQAWVVRYLIVETDSWLSIRKVLVSPIAIGKPDWPGRLLPVSITKQQVKDSPDIDTEKPVSRQHELQYGAYYGYPNYWGGVGYWSGGMYPNMMLPGRSGFGSVLGVDPQRQASNAQAESQRIRSEDAHLRSCRAVMKYHVAASDGDLGHVAGLFVDDETWAIRYLIVDTSNWWLGHQVLVAPQWIEGVSWPDSKVMLSMTRQSIKDAPPYDPALPPDRAHEADLHRHYGRAGYWAEDDKREKMGIPHL